MNLMFKYCASCICISLIIITIYVIKTVNYFNSLETKDLKAYHSISTNV